MAYINSDGQSIIQDWIHPHPIAVVGSSLVVNQGGNSEHIFSCGASFVFEECVVRIIQNAHEQRIAYSQASPRAALEAIALAFNDSCGAPVPPVLVPETINTLNCDGSISAVSFPDKVDRVVLVQDKPFVICTGKEFDKTILCALNGDKVIVVTTYDPITGVPTTIPYNLDGTVYIDAISSLVNCPDSDTESDRVQGCDGGVSVSKWVAKIDGVPTGTVYYTDDTTNAVVTPTSWTEGSCIVPVLTKNLIGGVLKVTDSFLGDGTTEYPSGFVLSDIPELQNGTHKLRSFAYKIYWNNPGEFLRVTFADTNTVYHYDDIFYHATSRFFGEDTQLDDQYLSKILFETKGRSFFEINYTLEQI